MEKTKRIWDNYLVVGEVQKSAAIKFVVGAAIRDGVKYINVREFYLRKRDGVWMPGRDGITIPLVVPINRGQERLTPYVEIANLFSNTATVLQTMELADPEHAVYKTFTVDENARKRHYKSAETDTAPIKAVARVVSVQVKPAEEEAE